MRVSLDPRLAVIEKRFENVRRILAVTGGKGGIGKSMVASTLALVLRESAGRVGLLDVDFTGPCDHIILGAESRFPEEEFGLVPPVVHGLRFMSVTHFVGDSPAPLRGADLSNALVELLCVTQWGELDALVVDMPPGISDATLDAVRLLPRAEFVVVTAPSRVVIETVSRTLRFLTSQETHVAGLLENMARGASPEAESLAQEHGVRWLGTLPFDDALEAALGDVRNLAETAFFEAVGFACRQILDGGGET